MVMKNRIPEIKVSTSGIMGVVDMIRTKHFFKVMDESYKRLISARNVLVLYHVDHYESSGKFNTDVRIHEIHLDLVFECEETGKEIIEHMRLRDPWEFDVKAYRSDHDHYNSDHYAHSVELDFGTQIGVIYFT